MSDTGMKLQIDHLTNSNWYKWKVQMRRYMESKELWSIIQDGDDAVRQRFDTATDQIRPALTKNNATAMSIILQCVDDTTFNLIQGEDYAYNMWKKLKSRFENTSAANQRLVYNEWKSLVYNNGGGVRDNISKFVTIAARYIAVVDSWMITVKHYNCYILFKMISLIMY